MNPSHLTFPQIARAVGVSREAVRDRAAKYPDQVVTFFGSPMMRWGDVRRWQEERKKRAAKVLKSGEL